MKEAKEKENKKIRFIGMRAIKTVIAVYICFLLGFLRESSLPFYSAIAAILSMQTDPQNSLEIGVNRIKGTITGCIYGFIAMKVINFIGVPILGHIHYLILSLFLIPIIYTNVHIKSYNSTYISCVVFLSITVAHGGDSTPMYFALNRFVDTLIGIGVSWMINIIM